jgi:2-polyprenyl-3-methyl-5-hydroxy-6-metoxy-1,4-benzoquinol methylase
MTVNHNLPRRVDFDQPWFHARMKELREPFQVHRKLWEFCAIAQVYAEEVGHGGRVLGFGVGKEPLAGFFAMRGAEVLATDAPEDAANWTETGQRATTVDDLLTRFSELNEEGLVGPIYFRTVDMNNIPPDVKNGYFDFTWSAGSLEHIGGARQSIDFICESMKCLRPGGIAAHTTEYGYPRLNTPNLCFFDVNDVAEIQDRLEAQGDELLPVDLESGGEPDDFIVSRPPAYKLPHIRCYVGPHVTTSLLLVARKG